MKIFAFVDLHGDFPRLRKIVSQGKLADIIICAGDISNFEQHLEKLLKLLSTVGKKVIMIHGNHEEAEITKEICDKYKNLIFLHQGVYEYKGVMFVGYGGGGFSKVDPKFEKFTKKVSPHLKGKIVLITHGPPYGTAVDNIQGESVGSKSIRTFIKKNKPKLAICGHLHENAELEDDIDETRVINPGKKGKLIII